MSICEDLTHGLLALHTSGIVHGDIKADNALVFGIDNSIHQEDTRDEERSFHGNLITKLTDFGSVILLDIVSKTTKYYGTPMTNAPEVEMQSSEYQSGAEDMLKCDAYSLGLLYLNMLTGRLDDCLTTKD